MGVRRSAGRRTVGWGMDGWQMSRWIRGEMHGWMTGGRQVDGR